MRGDFSSWRNERNQNFSGVLHQQGRVLLDSDWNAQTAITNQWQDTEAEDVIGSGVAAVPAGLPESFKITGAELSGSTVTLTVGCGRAWVDGMLVTLPGTSTRKHTASYLQPPIQSPAGSVGSIANAVRDAVVLEVWREEIHGFQLDKLLVEPALGGPDTTERLHTAFAFRLYRLADGQTCESITPEMRDDVSAKATLSATLKPVTVSSDDCPVVIGGGYTGFEHNLYRIEIARTDQPSEARFLWSQYNGGLAGRGTYNSASKSIAISSNLQAIVNAGLTSFYLEVVVHDPASGHWSVLCGANATLDSNGDLRLPNNAADYVVGGPPASTGEVFFRLWNGIAKVADFVASEKELAFGIHLQFSSANPLRNTPGDYWTFAVRAGEIANDEKLIDHQVPDGVHYHRVALGVITWGVGASVHSISDCRRLFQPLTRLGTCCTYRVGDGMRSHGDFNSIQKAIESLPASGGEICVLPGVYAENITISARQNITISGCGDRTRIISAQSLDLADALPVISIQGSSNITIQSLAIEAHPNGVGVMMNGLPIGIELQTFLRLGDPLNDVALNRLSIRAARRSAIEAYSVFKGAIRDCRIQMEDVASPWPAIFLVGEDVVIERNTIGVAGDRALKLDTPFAAERGRGGVQIGGTSERISILHNLIRGGVGNGITLGSLVERLVNGGLRPGGWVIDIDDPCKPGSIIIHGNATQAGNQRKVWESAGHLYDILIAENLILDRGLNGIGPVAFFSPSDQQELIGIHGLRIERNDIRRCLNRDIAEIPPDLVTAVAYGAIVLPDVDDLVVRDNHIAQIGRDAAAPACGLFVLHGEGIEISRNHIAVYPLLAAKRDAAALKPGLRCGIALQAVSTDTADTTDTARPRGGRNARRSAPVVSIHDNDVSIWCGPALLVVARCPLSVMANEFVSGGYDQSLGIAATVCILDVGMMTDLVFLLLAEINREWSRWYLTCRDGRLVIAEPNATANNDLPPVLALANVPSGSVLFSGNQCRLDLTGHTGTIVFTSVLIAGLDDVSFHGNQCDCLLGTNLILINAVLLGATLRVSDNRFREGLQNGFLSAVTLGLANTTSDNQADHCLLIRGMPLLTSSGFNTVLMKQFCENVCNGYESDFLAGKSAPGKA